MSNTAELKLNEETGTYEGEDEDGNLFVVTLDESGNPKEVEFVKYVRLETYYGT